MYSTSVRLLAGPTIRLNLLILCSVIFTGCVRPISKTESAPLSSPQIVVTQTELFAQVLCTGAFVPHNLDHTTTAKAQIVSLYESNGSGVGINDLDGDGDLDIVLANLYLQNTILWNEGDLAFRTQRLSHGNSRAVSIVDVDGDGLQDIVFTRRFDKPAYWHNTGQEGDRRFVEGVLPDVNNPFFTMDWADVDGDGDLDFVAASYDTEIRKQQGGIFEYRGGGIGVFVYQREGNTYSAQRLAEEADSLALALTDLNSDDKLDIVVGNDFDRPDYVWLHTDDVTADGWEAAAPFAATAENTMSYDVGDTNNDGIPEIFATDMKPYSGDDATMAAWAPLMGMMAHPLAPDDPQVIENVLLMRDSNGDFQNRASSLSIDATGWSWSSKFGDLDNDGFLDIYAVNGMIASDFLEHLPGNELVEENQALRNDGNGGFQPAPKWGLGSTASGRGMSMADLDGDGDLDIVVNNLASPAQLFENRLCNGMGIEVDLRWPTTQNPFAIGAQLTLETSRGTYSRTVRASSGYLSGDPARVHFGVPNDAIIKELRIRWPDGLESILVNDLNSQTLLTVVRNE